MTPTDTVLSVNGETGSVILSTGDISEDTNKKYVTDAEKTLLSNTSGVNTGDQHISGSGLSGTTLTIGISSGSNQTVNLSPLDNSGLTLQQVTTNGSSTTTTITHASATSDTHSILYGQLKNHSFVADFSGLKINGSTIDFTAPNTPNALTLTESADYVDISFTGNTDPVDFYEIYSSVGNTDDYGLIARIVANGDVHILDDTYNKKTTIYYKVYAIREGYISSARTGSIALSQNVADITNLQITRSIASFTLNYNLPEDRRLKHVKIYVDSDPSAASLAKPTTPIFTGLVDSYSYEVATSEMDNYFKF
jgi:hypothetical protein